MAQEVVEAIERQQMRLRQFFHIPGNEQETDLETKYFNEFRIEIEVVRGGFLNFIKKNFLILGN